MSEEIHKPIEVIKATLYTSLQDYCEEGTGIVWKAKVIMSRNRNKIKYNFKGYGFTIEGDVEISDIMDDDTEIFSMVIKPKNKKRLFIQYTKGEFYRVYTK